METTSDNNSTKNAMARSVCWTIGLKGFDDGIANQVPRQILRYHGSPTKLQGGNKGTILDTLEGSFGAHSEGELQIDHDKDDNQVVFAGYYIRGAEVIRTTKGHGGCVADVQDEPLTVGDLNQGDIFKVGYKMGTWGKQATPYIMANRNSNGLCSLFQVPKGAECVWYKPEFRDDYDSNKKSRERTVGARISEVTSRGRSVGEKKGTGKRADKTVGGNDQILNVTESDFSLRYRLAALVAKMDKDKSDSHATEELEREIANLGIRHPETQGNKNLMAMIYAQRGQRWNRNSASQALKEAKVSSTPPKSPLYFTLTFTRHYGLCSSSSLTAACSTMSRCTVSAGLSRKPMGKSLSSGACLRHSLV